MALPSSVQQLGTGTGTDAAGGDAVDADGSVGDEDDIMECLTTLQSIDREKTIPREQYHSTPIPTAPPIVSTPQSTTIPSPPPVHTTSSHRHSTASRWPTTTTQYHSRPLHIRRNTIASSNVNYAPPIAHLPRSGRHRQVQDDSEMRPRHNTLPGDWRSQMKQLQTSTADQSAYYAKPVSARLKNYQQEHTFADTKEMPTDLLNGNGGVPRSFSDLDLPSSAFSPAKYPPIRVEQHHKLDWSQVVGVRHSDTGSTGVLFVLLRVTDHNTLCSHSTAAASTSASASASHATPMGVVVLKASTTIAQEMFGTYIAQAAGLQAPSMRLMTREEPEWWDCKSNIERAAPDTLVRSIQRLFLRPLIMVMKFEHGTTLDELANGSSLSVRHLQGLGRVIAADLIMNNADRLPLRCVWNELNPGNPGNLMLIENTNDVAVIDNRAVTLQLHTAHGRSNALAVQYLTNLYSVALDVNERRENSVLFALVMEWINDVLAVHTVPREKPRKQILIGFHAGVDACFAALGSLEQQLLDMDAMCQVPFWKDMLKLIDMNFVRSTCGLLHEHYGLSTELPFELANHVPLSMQRQVSLVEGSIRITLCQAQPNAAQKQDPVNFVEENLVHLRDSDSFPDILAFSAQLFRGIGPQSASTEENKHLRGIIALAAEYKVHLLLGTMVELDGPRRFICTILVDDSGAIIGKYRKQFISRFEHNRLAIEAGSDIGLFRTRFGKIGVLIDDEIDHGNLVVDLARRKPILILNPVRTLDANDPAFQALCYKGRVAILDNPRTQLLCHRLEGLCQRYGVTVARIDTAQNGNPAAPAMAAAIASAVAHRRPSGRVSVTGAVSNRELESSSTAFIGPYSSVTSYAVRYSERPDCRLLSAVVDERTAGRSLAANHWHRAANKQSRYTVSRIEGLRIRSLAVSQDHHDKAFVICDDALYTWNGHAHLDRIQVHAPTSVILQHVAVASYGPESESSEKLLLGYTTLQSSGIASCNVDGSDWQNLYHLSNSQDSIRMVQTEPSNPSCVWFSTHKSSSIVRLCMKTGQVLTCIDDCDGSVFGVNSRYLVTCTGRVWDYSSSQPNQVAELSLPSADSNSSSTCKAKASCIALTEYTDDNVPQSIIIGTLNGHIAVYEQFFGSNCISSADPESPKVNSTLTFVATNAVGGIRALSFVNPSGSWFLSGCGDGSMMLWCSDPEAVARQSSAATPAISDRKSQSDIMTETSLVHVFATHLASIAGLKWNVSRDILFSYSASQLACWQFHQYRRPKAFDTLLHT
jgi:Actin-fragmin kinase, catalytic/Carbon-nitrogen hydrolase